MARKPEKPHGRDAVKTALMQAAARLFSIHGFAGVSIRDIASEAGVNPGLIHRHFKTKETLRKETQEYLASLIRLELDESLDLEHAAVSLYRLMWKHEEFWRMMVRDYLDGMAPDDIQKKFPVAEYLTGLVKESIEKGTLRRDLNPDLIVAAMFSIGLGLLVFEPFILSASGLDKKPADTARKEIFAAALSLIKNKN
jgi:TetR/AcrR family transcriptional regulator, repressor for neighboring sulfatase